MNTLTTTQFEIINTSTIKHSNPTELSVKTQEEKIVLSKAINQEAAIYLDETMTTRILDISAEATYQHDEKFAREYLVKAKGLVTDVKGRIDRAINLLAAPPVVDVEDDERVTELETELETQKAEAKKLYEDKLTATAVLNADLKRANEVIQKLQAGDDVTKALKEAASLKEQLEKAKGVAGNVPALRSELESKAEALAGAKTKANGLIRQIQEAKEETKRAEAELDKNTGEALLDYETKQNAKALASIEVAKKVREGYPLQAFLLQNDMTAEQIKLATSSAERTLYDTADVEDIASIIHSERGVVTDEVIVDKITTLVSGALREVARAENQHTYETLKNTWYMQVKAMTENALQ